MNEILLSVLQIAIASILAFLILRRPYLGIALTATSLPVIDLLPPIPLLTSAVPLIGAITLVGFMLHRVMEPEKPLFSFGSVHILGLLFIGWMFLVNPQAAWFGATRNWVLTFLQLWVLAWLAGELLDTPEKHHVFMWVYSIGTITSALVVIQQGKIGEDIDTSLRVSGFAGGANSAARYFVVAIVFLSYLRTVMNQRLPRLLAIVGMTVTIIGVFLTVSRTGILLLFAALGLLVLLRPRRKHQFQLIFVFAIALFALWFLADSIFDIVKSIIPAITQGTDTVGVRYGLWQAGWRMWLDNILQGVGIGLYPEQLRYYAQDLLPVRFWSVGAHNMYVQVLAETGLIGFGLFVLLLIMSLRNIWRAGNINDVNIFSLRNVWFIVFLVMLLGGITKNDHFDKLIWLVMGISVYFHNQLQMRTQKTAVYNPARSVQV